MSLEIPLGSSYFPGIILTFSDNAFVLMGTVSHFLSAASCHSYLKTQRVAAT